MSSDQPAIGIGPNLDQEVLFHLFHSCSEDDDGSEEGGSDSDANCFSTISLDNPDDTPEVSGPTRFEDVEGIELGFGGSPEAEGLELGGLGKIA